MFQNENELLCYLRCTFNINCSLLSSTQPFEVGKLFLKYDDMHKLSMSAGR